MFTWGCNDEGALGRETRDGEEYSPGQVLSLKEVVIIQLSAGDSHTAALATNGDVYCWGVFRVSFFVAQLGSFSRELVISTGWVVITATFNVLGVR